MDWLIVLRLGAQVTAAPRRCITHHEVILSASRGPNGSGNLYMSAAK